MEDACHTDVVHYLTAGTDGYAPSNGVAIRSNRIDERSRNPVTHTILSTY